MNDLNDKGKALKHTHKHHTCCLSYTSYNIHTKTWTEADRYRIWWRSKLLQQETSSNVDDDGQRRTAHSNKLKVRHFLCFKERHEGEMLTLESTAKKIKTNDEGLQKIVSTLQAAETFFINNNRYPRKYRSARCGYVCIHFAAKGYMYKIWIGSNTTKKGGERDLGGINDCLMYSRAHSEQSTNTKRKRP